MITVERAAELARERWGRSSPYRVGLIMGEHCAVYANPYESNPRGAANWRDGVAGSVRLYKMERNDAAN